MPMSEAVFVVPIKRFEIAKERLRAGGVADVTALARRLAEGVLRSCAPRPLIVLSESPEVTLFAHELGVEVLESDATSLNDAVQSAYDELGSRFDRVVVVHGDLRRPEGLRDFEVGDGVTIVTDHHATGTNVLSVPTNAGFRFFYGEGSASKHAAEALRLRLAFRLFTNSPWRFDVDEPEDLDA
jgi:2-phospho-L-lactate guanylyltransferase (CobY/MobA/RfbA family)